MHVSFLVTGVVEVEVASEGVICQVKGVRLSGEPDFFKVGEEILPAIAYQLAVKSLVTDLLPKLRVDSEDGEVHPVTPAGNTQPPGAA
jgi:hypothetical protein